MKKYVEVDREPVVGDMVKIVNAEDVPTTNGVDDYKVGDILKIIGERDGLFHPLYHYKSDFSKVLRRKEFVVVEEVEQFTKSDLKPCMVVRLRDEELYIVSESKEGLCLNDKEGSFMKLSSYNDDMTYSKNITVAKRYDIIEAYSLKVMQGANEISAKGRDLLFKREEQSSRDIKIKELQDKMDAIKREMEELK